MKKMRNEKINEKNLMLVKPTIKTEERNKVTTYQNHTLVPGFYPQTCQLY
jgi:hypothetical protein